MARTLTVPQPVADPTVNLCLDAIAKGKQSIVFCNTKRGAESQAERVAAKAKAAPAFHDLAGQALKALPSPTKQCRRLAKCLERGVAFHHAGLHSKQRSLVEDGFRDGVITTICSTPTLAMGLDLPAFRVVIRDLKRFGGGSWGMTDIPVLEYHQMAGRAGRPGKEAYGEAVVLAENDEQAEKLVERYVHGEAEEVVSKLAVEPVLRTYVLSLIAGEFVGSRAALHTFFERTFYAQQYGDTRRLRQLLDAMARKLEEWGFLEQRQKDGFVSADALDDDALEATPLGRRVAELYLDPFTAHFLVTCLKRASSRTLTTYGLLHMLSSCLEMRPLLRPRVREVEDLVARAAPFLEDLLAPEPVQYSHEYEEFLMAVKTAFFLDDWVEETGEEALLERYAVRPGEVHAKLERADWLVYASEELVRLLGLQALRAPLARLRLRLKHGAKEELLPLLRLKGVGRVRARLLFKNGLRTVAALKKAETSALASLLGPRVAANVKEQLGEKVEAPVKRGKRHGQLGLAKFS